ncbi:BrnT family toxin [Polynucleobacter ibericus]|uniref:BrnT family toxin n=1 Tax=Polynucleobacter ibericus TaxID=1819725 RepID=UPI001BFCFC65|nr:BrnT family toxin [Polynucleobacter ibericus]QWE07977.1 BrnT family toxin [Polynucleobacter ibericus]
MEITYDQSKNLHNIRHRNLSFEEVREFDFETANFAIDKRKNYGEIRRCTLGYLGSRLHALVFTETIKGIPVISFRKANKREIESYEQKNKA